MLALLSPAKKLDFSDPDPALPRSLPEFAAQAAALADIARRAGRAGLQRAMKLSDALAELTFSRFRDFADNPDAAAGKQAALAFAGDTYVGLAAGQMTAADLAWAQHRLRILSGLYGLLRPLDVIQPYRLEMGCRLDTGSGRNLYDFWGDRLSKALARDLADHPAPVIVNLASQEYFRSVADHPPACRVITPHFKENRGGTLKTIGIVAKRARGAMAAWIVRNRLEDPEALKDFNRDGYVFQGAPDGADDWLFARAG